MLFSSHCVRPISRSHLFTYSLAIAYWANSLSLIILLNYLFYFIYSRAPIVFNDPPHPLLTILPRD